MLPSRSIISSFFVVLLMLCVTYSTSTKNNVQASDTKLDLHGDSGFVKATRSTIIILKENNDVVPTLSENIGLELTRRHGTRKLMAKRPLVKEEIHHKFGAKCRHGLDKGMLNVDCDFRRNINNNPSMKSKLDDFIAFDVDYHVPRPHPPKNN